MTNRIILAMIIASLATTSVSAQQPQRWPGYLDSTARERSNPGKSARPETRPSVRTSQIPHLRAVNPRPVQTQTITKPQAAAASNVQQAGFFADATQFAQNSFASIAPASTHSSNAPTARKQKVSATASVAATNKGAKLDSLLSLPGKGEGKSGFELPGGLDSVKDMGISLGIVLAAFLGLTWILKKTSAGNQRGGLPNQIVQVLGRAPLDSKQQMQLVRLGDRILLLAISQNGTETLGEITDRDEVDAMIEICQSKNPSKIRESFRETLYRVRLDRQAHSPASFSRTA